MKEKASQAGARVSERMGSMATQMSSQIKERADRAMESTSKGIDRVAVYLREKDSRQMMRDLQHTVRKYPGRSLAAGLVVGLLIGRAMR